MASNQIMGVIIYCGYAGCWNKWTTDGANFGKCPKCGWKGGDDGISIAKHLHDKGLRIDVQD